MCLIYKASVPTSKRTKFFPYKEQSVTDVEEKFVNYCERRTKNERTVCGK